MAPNTDFQVAKGKKIPSRNSVHGWSTASGQVNNNGEIQNVIQSVLSYEGPTKVGLTPCLVQSIHKLLVD